MGKLLLVAVIVSAVCWSGPQPTPIAPPIQIPVVTPDRTEMTPYLSKLPEYDPRTLPECDNSNIDWSKPTPPDDSNMIPSCKVTTKELPPIPGNEDLYSHTYPLHEK